MLGRFRRPFVPVTDYMEWHCVRCDARLALDGTRWSERRPMPRAMFAEDAKKVCPECAGIPVPPVEQQVERVLTETMLNVMFGR